MNLSIIFKALEAIFKALKMWRGNYDNREAAMIIAAFIYLRFKEIKCKVLAVREVLTRALSFYRRTLREKN